MKKEQYFQNYQQFLAFEAVIARWQGAVLVLCLLLTGVGAWWIMILNPPIPLIIIAIISWFVVLLSSLVAGGIRSRRKREALQLNCPGCHGHYSDRQLVSLAFTGRCPVCDCEVFTAE